MNLRVDCSSVWQVVGMPADTLDELLSRKQPLQGIQQLLRPEFKIGRAYFIPADQTPVIPAEVHTVVTLPAAATFQIARDLGPG